jgi:DNA (cytosine-5)-methyltransferase 1
MYTMNALSLFSGCGGDSLGMKRAGYNVIAYSEFKQPAIDSHQANFPDSTLIKDSKGKFTDITKIEDSQFEPYKGKVDLVFAGFPCQGFSRAGKKKVTDPRNQMFRHFVRAVKATQPRHFIGENVTGLTSMKSGANETDPLMLDIIKAAFAEIGYTLSHTILEARNFGAPQRRKRCLLVGWRTDTAFDAPAFWKAVDAFGATKVTPTLRSFVKKTLEGAYKLPEASIPDDFERYALPIPEDMEPTGEPHPFVVLKANAANKQLSCSKRESPTHSEIIDLDAPSKTIICTYDHQPRLLVGYRKPSGVSYARVLLPDELKQIQGFPADYKVLGSPKDQVVQIGNAVPPQMIEAIASTLKNITSAATKVDTSVKVKRVIKVKKATQ